MFTYITSIGAKGFILFYKAKSKLLKVILIQDGKSPSVSINKTKEAVSHEMTS